MANDKSFKVKNGLQAGRYLQSAGTETTGSTTYDIAGASYDNVSVATASARPFGLGFSSDGTRMYICDDEYSGVLGIIQKALSTAWDVSTATSDGSLDVSAKDIDPMDIAFKSDGTVMFFVGDSSNSVHAYTLSTAWDVTSATFSKSFSLATQGSDPKGIDFKPDGTAMYTVDIGTDTVYQYSLSTPWDLNSASYASKSFSPSSAGAPSGNTYKFKFNNDGTKGFVLLPDSQGIYQFSFSTAYDLSSVTYDSVSFSLSSQATDMFGLAFKPDGTKMYTVSFNTDTIYQYSTGGYTQTLDLSTGTSFSFTPSGATEVSFTNPPASGIAIGFAVEINGDGSAITWPSSVKWHLGAAPTATASKEVYTFITTDGGTSYVGKRAGQDIA